MTAATLKTIETAIRHSVHCVALTLGKTTSETMRMTFDATAFVSVTVGGVGHVVRVNRQAMNGCTAIEEYEKSGYETLYRALDKALGSEVRFYEIERTILKAAENAFEDDDAARVAKVTNLMTVVRAADASGDAALRSMVTELLVRALLERYPDVLHATRVARVVAHLFDIGHTPVDALNEMRDDFADAYKRIEASTGVKLEALRKAAMAPVAEVGDTIDGLFTDVVFPKVA
ncbi:hypothetical protein [Burkholderia sp. LMG 13014]|uniref:hypothetical protein n=1 Tax=Burkholderia sp. LMG 13014 TaxID=2709306 RepID=UPI0019645B1C|nr:hypothetical protein [Burkholderia sp. LMG 13014]